MVWSKTDLRFGSNQWFETKPTPEKGQTKWFEAKPTPGKGQTRWFEAKPTPEKGQTRWFEAKPTPGKDQTRWFEAKQTPGKGQTRWLDERGASAWGGRAFTPTQSGPASLDVSERQAPKVDALRAAAQKGRSDEASDGEASSSGGGGGTWSAKRPAGSEGTAGAASVSGSTFQARMSLYQRPL